MTAKELLSNYAKAENEFFTAIETIRKNKEILIKDFEEKNPGKAFYEITDSIPTKSERKVVKEYLNHYRYYQY